MKYHFRMDGVAYETDQPRLLGSQIKALVEGNPESHLVQYGPDGPTGYDGTFVHDGTEVSMAGDPHFSLTPTCYGDGVGWPPYAHRYPSQANSEGGAS